MLDMVHVFKIHPISQFAQLYIYDTENDLGCRMGIFSAVNTSISYILHIAELYRIIVVNIFINAFIIFILFTPS